MRPSLQSFVRPPSEVGPIWRRDGTRMSLMGTCRVLSSGSVSTSSRTSDRWVVSRDIASLMPHETTSRRYLPSSEQELGAEARDRYAALIAAASRDAGAHPGAMGHRPRIVA